MESILPFIAVAALVLACPLGMAAIGGVAWVVARAQGKKKDPSMGCMGGHGEHGQASGVGEESTLRAEVTRLQNEVDSLKAQSRPAGRATSEPSDVTSG